MSWNSIGKIRRRRTPVTTGKPLSRLWDDLRIMPIWSDAAATYLCHPGRVSVSVGTRPSSQSRKIFFPGPMGSRMDGKPSPFHQIVKEVPMTMISQGTSHAGEEKLQRTKHLNGAPAMRAIGAKPRMVRLTVNLPSDLVEQMRDAVYWTPGLTLAWMIARSVRTSLIELEQAHQGPFPKRSKPLRAGRPRLLGQAMKVQAQPSNNGGTPSGDRTVRTRVVSEPAME
jgi:hypothetical protein